MARSSRRIANYDSDGISDQSEPEYPPEEYGVVGGLIELMPTYARSF